MLFNSLSFAIFLPLVFVLYWLIGGKRLRVVFVIGPCSPSWCKLFTGGDVLRKWVKEFNVRMADSHLMVLDLFSDSDFERHDFTDPTHLNRDGAIRFSRELKRRLR